MSDEKDQKGEAMWGMTIMMIVLVIVVIFFCMLPVYRLLEKRWKHWDQIENDPRWNVDHFQFAPTSAPGHEDTRYNRLSNCSTDLGREPGINRGNSCVLPRMTDQVELKMPPSYADLFADSSGDLSSLGTPPAYRSTTPSEAEDNNPEKEEFTLAQRTKEKTPSTEE
eukprot:GFUD01023005.1.p1 GENE.GFUD01023005.1~~GFUD01023005.1.p1  ORF type:complete len:167 (-),score=47.25 GFUD01023005.1:102-602(-)